MPRFGIDPIATGTDDLDLVDIPTPTAIGSWASDEWSLGASGSFAAASDLETQLKGRQQSATSLARFGTLPRATVKVSPTISAAEARARIKEAGLDGHLTVPDSGIPGGALAVLIDHKRTEMRNRFIADRYRGGVLGGVAQLGTRLAVSLADPLNIASAFVPVVGEARYAQILGRAGTSLLARGGARAGIGGLEGLAGSALLEPLVYTSQQQLQADYGVEDSLLNIGFGGVFGGFLHAGGGGVADLLARRAGTGAWAETIRTDGSRDLPDLPDTFVPGGGTRWIDGDDYARGQFAVVEAERIHSTAQGFDDLDPAQVGQSPYAGAGAPVLRPDGSVIDGSRRVSTVRQAYTAGQGEAYRSGLIQDAAKYGLSPEDVAAMAQPVLVRVEGAREAGGAASLKGDANTPASRFESWFGGSQVVDAEGQPLRVYHGTADAFDEFAAGKGSSDGFHFTSDPAAASRYAQSRNMGGGRPENVIPVYLSLKNPKRVDSPSNAEIAQAIEEGHDGLIVGDGHFIAFKPEQIKSVFDEITPDQAATALRMGIAQAVNGAEVDVAAVRHLDGTPEGVERFLADKARAEADADARLAAEAEATAKTIAAGLDVTDAAKLDADVKALEQEIRTQLEAAGEDLAAFDAAMAQMDELAAELSTEAKALQGAAMCMQRGG